MKIKIYIYVTLLVSTSALSNEIIAEPTNPDELLDFLVKKNEDAWDKIQSLQTLQYGVNIDRSSKRSKEPLHDVAEIKQKGKYIWSWFQEGVYAPSTTSMDEVNRKVTDSGHTMRLMRPTGPLTHQKILRRLIVNNSYSVWTNSESNFISWRYHASIEDAQEELTKRVQQNTPKSLMNYCFGENNLAFRDAIEKFKGRMQYEAQKIYEEGSYVYQIKRKPIVHKNDGVQPPEMTWIIDPNSGYLAIEAKFNNPERGYGIHNTFKVKEIVDGVWYPIQCTEERFDTKNGTPQRVSWYKSTTNDIVCNAAIQDSQFTFESLQLHEDMPDAIVIKARVDGTKVPYVFDGDALVLQRPDR